MVGRALEELPGYRRRILIQPANGSITTALEDDMHCMMVRLYHDGNVVTGVDAEMERWPWTTCTGAVATLKISYIGLRLSAPGPRQRKKMNCTHLFDLAELGQAHARDTGPTRYDILASDPDATGLVVTEIRRNDALIHRIAHCEQMVVQPDSLANVPLFKLRSWIDGLPPQDAEAARLLQWGALVAHGRVLPWDQQCDATKLPANCYSLQPGERENAVRFGKVMDFSTGGRMPLDHFDGKSFTPRDLPDAGSRPA